MRGKQEMVVEKYKSIGLYIDYVVRAVSSNFSCKLAEGLLSGMYTD